MEAYAEIARNEGLLEKMKEEEREKKKQEAVERTRSLKIWTGWPLMMSLPSADSTVPLKRPWVESYVSWYTM